MLNAANEPHGLAWEYAFTSREFPLIYDLSPLYRTSCILSYRSYIRNPHIIFTAKHVDKVAIYQSEAWRIRADVSARPSSTKWLINKILCASQVQECIFCQFFRSINKGLSNIRFKIQAIIIKTSMC